MEALEVFKIAYQLMFEDFWKIMDNIGIAYNYEDVKYVIIMPSHSSRNVQDFILDSAVMVRKYFYH